MVCFCVSLPIFAFSDVIPLPYYWAWWENLYHRNQKMLRTNWVLLCVCFVDCPELKKQKRKFSQTRLNLKVFPAPSCCIIIKLKSVSLSTNYYICTTQKFEKYTSNVRKLWSNPAKKSLVSLTKEQRLRSLLFHFHLTH